jgi:hypothetical protein
MHELYFKSKLEYRYYSEVERLFFFNSNQKIYLNSIYKVCEEFGYPKLITDNKYVYINFDDQKYQTLFVMDSSEIDSILIGIVILCIFKINTVKIVHVAVQSECTINGNYDLENVTYRIIQNIMTKYSRIKNIKFIELPYSTRKFPINKKIINEI